MSKGVRNEPDSGPTSEGAVITYSRVPARGAKPSAERQEPFLDAHEVPYRDDDLRAYDPERASGLDGDVVDDLAEPPRTRRRGARGFVLIGALALAAGMVIVAYAYGVATRVDAPSLSSAGAPATDAAATPRTDVTSATPTADDTARSATVTGAPPAVDDASSAPADPRPAVAAEPPTPKPAPEQAAIAPAHTPSSGVDGLPMDGDSGAEPALVAPVPATKTPPAPDTRRSATIRTDAPSERAAPAGGSDDLMTNIERLLANDRANNAGAATGPTALAPQPAPLGAEQQVDDPNALPPLPAPGAVADAPPIDSVPPPRNNRLIPPADIPDAWPSDSATGGLQ